MKNLSEKYFFLNCFLGNATFCFDMLMSRFNTKCIFLMCCRVSAADIALLAKHDFNLNNLLMNSRLFGKWSDNEKNIYYFNY